VQSSKNNNDVTLNLQLEELADIVQSCKNNLTGNILNITFLSSGD